MLSTIHDFLGCRTPDAWLAQVPEHIDLLLQDHANCEKKAAATAINLMFSYGHKPELQRKLAQLAREELLHYEQVMALMDERHQPFVALSASHYVSALRKVVRTHEPARLVDILIAGAFIEARSCERFAALVPYVDESLGRYYRYLLKSESRHFKDYLALARLYAEEDIEPRIACIRQAELAHIEGPDDLFRFHSGVPVTDQVLSSSPCVLATST